MRCLPWILVALALFCSAGCGGFSDGKQAVGGNITLQGAPLDQGTITFFKPDINTPAAGALIEAGKYKIPGEQGLEPGTYRVTINSSASAPLTPEEYAAGKTRPPAKERIPAKYNTESKVTVEVKSSGENRFDFQVE